MLQNARFTPDPSVWVVLFGRRLFFLPWVLYYFIILLLLWRAKLIDKFSAYRGYLSGIQAILLSMEDINLDDDARLAQAAAESKRHAYGDCRSYADWLYEQGDPELIDSVARLYARVAALIRISYFTPGAEEVTNDDFMALCDQDDSLKPLLPRTRRMLWKDVPRTFSAFIHKSPMVAGWMEHPYSKSYLQAILCRVLATSLSLLRLEYCQGMNFVASATIIHCISAHMSPDGTRSAPATVELDRELEVKACLSFCYMLSLEELRGLYDRHLSMQMQKLEYLMSKLPQTLPAIEHLKQHGYSVHYYALEWLTTGYVLSLPLEISREILGTLIYDADPEVLIRAAVAIVISLKDEILYMDSK